MTESEQKENLIDWLEEGIGSCEGLSEQFAEIIFPILKECQEAISDLHKTRNFPRSRIPFKRAAEKGKSALASIEKLLGRA